MSTEATQLLPPPTWNDPRVHLLDDTWLLTIFAILLATALPWLSGAFEIRFIQVSLGLLALGGLHSVLGLLGKRVRQRRSVLSALHVAGVLVVGFIWMQAGGLQNPAFLMVFALPVVGAIFLSRWQPYLMAVVALVTTVAVALAQAPELRWYVPGLNAAGAWLGNVVGQTSTSAGPFAGFYAPSAYYVALFEIFAVFILACAVAAEYLGTIFERLHGQVEAARVEADRSQQLWSSLVEQLSTPALLIDTDSLRIVASSRAATAFLGVEAGELDGAALFDSIRFSYPEMVQELIGQTGGTLPQCVIRIGDRLHATEVQVQHLSRKGRRFALVTIADKTEEFTAKTALDVTGQAALVIDSRGFVAAFNKPARVLFPQIERDMDASQLLSLTGLPPRWWEQVLSGRRKTQVEIAPRIYEVTISTAPWPGEEERLYVVTFQPVARAANGFRPHSTGTTQIQQGVDSTGSNRTLVSLP
jgi:hypothetical protein